MFWILAPAGHAVLEGCDVFRGVALLKEVGHWGQALGFNSTDPLSVCSLLHDANIL